MVTLDRAHLLLAFALVSPEWRNRGVGTALVIRSGNRLSAMGATEWTLAVTVGNPAAARGASRVPRGPQPLLTAAFGDQERRAPPPCQPLLPGDCESEASRPGTLRQSEVLGFGTPRGDDSPCFQRRTRRHRDLLHPGDRSGRERHGSVPSSGPDGARGDRQKVLAHDSNVARTIVEQGQVVGISAAGTPTVSGWLNTRWVVTTGVAGLPRAPSPTSSPRSTSARCMPAWQSTIRQHPRARQVRLRHRGHPPAERRADTGDPPPTGRARARTGGRLQHAASGSAYGAPRLPSH